MTAPVFLRDAESCGIQKAHSVVSGLFNITDGW